MTFLLLVLFVVPAALLVATRLHRREGTRCRSDLDHAGFLVLFAFALYAFGIVLGTLGLLSVPFLLLLSILVLAMLFRSEWRHALARATAIKRELNLAVTQFPPLLFILLLFIVLVAGTPMHGGDSLGYHLPNVRNMIEAGSTATLDPGHMYRPDTATAYYPKGMETIYALFYLFPLSHVTIVLFKTILMASAYFMVKAACRSRLVAAGALALLVSTHVVWHDLGTLKNDLPLALVLTFAAQSLVTRRTGGLPTVSIAAALALALSLKSSALFYVACLFPLWIAREYRRPGRLVAATAAVALFGGYFYVANALNAGSPFHPYGVTVLGHELFEGLQLDLWRTTLLANLSGESLPLLARGLVRQAGPLGTGVLACTMLLAIWQAVGMVVRRRVRGIRAMPLLLLLLFAAGYAITPYSDTTGDVPHEQLVSGHSVRMALPVILLSLVIASGPMASFLRRRETRGRALAWALGLVVVTNVFWYDLVTLFAKPGNAFLFVAPLAGTFENLVLSIVLAIATSLAALMAFARRGVAVPVAFVVAAVLFLSTYPESLGRTMRFKQIGETTSAFRVLQDAHLDDEKVAVVSRQASSYFVGCMNDLLMRGEGTIRFARNTENLDAFDVAVVCAVDESTHSSVMTGQAYTPTLAFFDPRQVPEQFKLLYQDDFYVVYVKVK